MNDSTLLNSNRLPDFDKLWNYGNSTETERQFRAILPEAEASNDMEYLAQLLTQIARCQGLQGDFESSHATLDRVEKLISLHSIKLGQVRYLLERGRALNSSGKPSDAMQLFLSAYELADSLCENRFAIDAIHMIAIAESDPNKQVAWNLKGLALAETNPDQKGWLFALLNNIGESYLLLKEYQNAHESFKRLSELQMAKHGEQDIYTVKDMAKALRLGGNPDESRKLLLPILERGIREGKDDGYIRQEYAEALYALGNAAEAKPHFYKAYELLSKDPWASSNDKEGLERAKRLS